MNGVSIGDERFEPFFAAAEKTGAAIFVHALRPAGQDRHRRPVHRAGGAAPGRHRSIACASLITGGIGMRHPKLRIAFSHGGGVMSILLPRLMHAWNVSPKAKEGLAEAPAVTAKRFYYDQLVFDPSAVRFVMQTFGDTQILIGTDYPYAHG